MNRIQEYKLPEHLESFLMLDIKAIRPSASKDARVKITDLRFNETVYIEWDFAIPNALGVAYNWLQENTTLEPIGYGLTKTDYFLLVRPVDHHFTSLKQSLKSKNGV